MDFYQPSPKGNGTEYQQMISSDGILYSNENHGKGDFTKAEQWFANQYQW